MIIVHTRVRCLRQLRQQFVELLRNMVSETREEDGCLRYAYVVDVDDDCIFYGVEEWRDEEALRAHLAAPHMNDPHSNFDAWSSEPETVRVFAARELSW